MHGSDRGKKNDIVLYSGMHEVAEMPSEHQLHFSDEEAHQIALHAERALVVSDGLSWPAYNRFCARWIKVIASRTRYANPPADIDLQPERDCKDHQTLRRMNLPAKAKAWPKTPTRRRNRDVD